MFVSSGAANWWLKEEALGATAFFVTISIVWESRNMLIFEKKELCYNETIQSAVFWFNLQTKERNEGMALCFGTRR